MKPKVVSKSDPAAQWTGALKGHAFFSYATNYLSDLEHAVIVDVEASRAIRQAEVGAARTMIERTQDRFDLWPARLAADSAYGSAENLAWLVHGAGLSPTFRSSTSRSARTAPSAVRVHLRLRRGHLRLPGGEAAEAASEALPASAPVDRG